MAHPMSGILGHNQPQMGGIFDDLLKNLNTSIGTGLDKAKNDAINKTLQQIIKEPAVQNAVVESGNDAAIQSLAQQLRSAQTSTVNYVRQNPYSTLLMAGGAVVGVILLMKLVR